MWYNNKDSKKTDTTQINVTEHSVSSEEDTSESRYFLNYDNILNRYRELLSNKHNEINIESNKLYSDENDCVIENALKSTVINSDGSEMGYAIYDVNDDGRNELFLIDEHYHIYAVFSQIKAPPILLDTFSINNNYVSLDQNGTFYKSGYGKGDNSYTKIMKLADNGNFKTIIEYGCIDDGESCKYYVIENNVESIVGLQDISILRERYNPFLQDTSNTTKNSGILFIQAINK